MKIISLYDGTCSLCQETKKWCERLDWLGRIHWVSLQEYEKENHTYSFDPQELRKELHLISPSGEILKGFFAVRKLLLQFPATVVIALVCYLPFMKKPGSVVYKWIAKNRHRLFRKKCKDGSCFL